MNMKEKIKELLTTVKKQAISEVKPKEVIDSISWVKSKIQEDILRGRRYELYVHEKEKNENVACFRIYTDNYKYYISVHRHDKKEDYLGCVMTCRKPYPGEDWNRGNDLPDGNCNEETWDKIKSAIIMNELVQLSSRTRAMIKNPEEYEKEMEDVDVEECYDKSSEEEEEKE